MTASGDGTGNTTPPADDFGFENVGITDNGTGARLSGIYLGDGWVLTAAHVGAQPITLKGVTYSPVSGSGKRLQNDSGPPPDLYVYRIDGFPVLPSIVLSSGGPLSTVHCTGHGWTRQPNLTTWNSAWQEQPPPVHKGYEAITGRSARRWGTNLVAAAGIDVNNTRSFVMLFDDIGGTEHEMQAVFGDSGGGCFAKRNGTWELVGVMFVMLSCANQPGSTVVFVDGTCENGTAAADVAFYRQQIEALTPPLGDVPALPAASAAALAALLVLLAMLRVPRRAGSSAGQSIRLRT